MVRTKFSLTQKACGPLMPTQGLMGALFSNALNVSGRFPTDLAIEAKYLKPRRNCPAPGVVIGDFSSARVRS
jgi:hypothetical protein